MNLYERTDTGSLSHFIGVGNLIRMVKKAT